MTKTATAPKLQVVKPSTEKPVRRAPRPAAVVRKDAGVLDQIRVTARSPLALVTAILFGGVPILVTFWIGHFEINREAPLQDPLSVLVLGGLVFSAPKVVKWAREAFGEWTLAVGFVVLLEGAMTFIHSMAVSAIIMILIMMINIAYTATRLVRGQRM